MSPLPGLKIGLWIAYPQLALLGYWYIARFAGWLIAVTRAGCATNFGRLYRGPNPKCSDRRN